MSNAFLTNMARPVFEEPLVIGLLAAVKSLVPRETVPGCNGAALSIPQTHVFLESLPEGWDKYPALVLSFGDGTESNRTGHDFSHSIGVNFLVLHYATDAQTGTIDLFRLSAIVRRVLHKIYEPLETNTSEDVIRNIGLEVTGSQPLDVFDDERRVLKNIFGRTIQARLSWQEVVSPQDY